MTTTISRFIRTLAVAALLAAAAMSMPAGDAQAAVKCPADPPGTPARSCCTYKGVIHVPGSTFTVGNKTYACDDDGSWIIITDLTLDPGTQPPPPLGFPLHGALVPVGGVLSLH